MQDFWHAAFAVLVGVSVIFEIITLIDGVF
jgi:hypothetical protein